MTGRKIPAILTIIGSVGMSGAFFVLFHFCIVRCAFFRGEAIGFLDNRKTGGICPPAERTVFDQWKRSRIKNCAVS